jgi:PucR C-terminal helix-turn-helix domain
MISNANSGRSPLGDARAGVVERLRARRGEIEETIIERIRCVAPDAGGGDVQYEAGQCATVRALVGYALMGIEHGEEGAGPIPSEAVTQAQRAARNGIGLDTILRRYAIGHTLLAEAIMAEAEHCSSKALRHLLGTQGSLLDRLMDWISSEYKCELERVGRSGEQLRAERVRRLLAGQPVDVAELDYEFDAWHLGLIATGVGAREVVWALQAKLNRALLLMPCGEEVVWAWLGGQRSLAIVELERLLSASEITGVSLAVGEAGWGVEGWRLTHRQAQEALRVALRRKRQRLTRYADVPLEAAMLRDERLAKSLVEHYLGPLGSWKDGGAALLQTLRAYFDAERSISSTAIALGVARHTVEYRLRTIEKKIGRLLPTCLVELEVVMRLKELDDTAEGRQ